MDNSKGSRDDMDNTYPFCADKQGREGRGSGTSYSDIMSRQNHYVIPRSMSKSTAVSFSNGDSYYSKGFPLLCFPKIVTATSRRCCNLKLMVVAILTTVVTISLYSGLLTYFVPRLRERLLFSGPAVLKDIVFQNPAFKLRFGSSNNEQTTHFARKRYPGCIIFGVSKCGTRAVLEYLKLHPEVVAPSAEVNFFNNRTLLNKGLNWYLQQMPFARTDQIVVEKSPDYFQNPESANDIHKMNSSIKLILLLRDPVERLVSQYMQLLEKNPSLPSFEKWVINPNTENVNTKIPSVMVSAYSEHLKHWFSIFSKSQMHIVESDRLREKPLEEMKGVEKFLGLKPFYTSSDFYYNATRKFFCIRFRDTGKTKCLGKSKGRVHISVKHNILDILYKFYEPYNERLNDLLGYKFPWS